MRYIYIYLLLILFFGCGQSSNDRIVIPEIDRAFYESALEDLNLQYENHPSEQVLRQKLFYYEKLGWPKSAISDLNLYLESHGLDESLVLLFLDYYLINNEHDQLIELLNKWEFYHGLDNRLSKYRLMSLVESRGYDSSKIEINKYLSRNQNIDSYSLAVELALNEKDTSYALTYFDKMIDLDSTGNTIPLEFVPLLFETDDYQKAYEILTNGVSSYAGSENYKVTLAQCLIGLDNGSRAVEILNQVHNQKSETILVNWYFQNNNYDSAIFYVDKLIERDSARNYLLLKSDILHKRGWLYASNKILAQMLEANPNDSIALNKANIVARKIAYLRSIKEQEQTATE